MKRKMNWKVFGACLMTAVLCGSLTPVWGQTFNYADALGKAVYFYDAQRAGKLSERGKEPGKNRVPWRGDSTLDDGKDAGADLSGGFFDAGDHVKLGFPMAYSFTALAWGILEYGQGYEQTGQLPFMLENLQWAADYFVKAHTAPNELWGHVGRVDWDHSFWGACEVMPMERPAQKIDASRPGSDLAGETAAALAAIHMVFDRHRDQYPQYAQWADERDLLRHARELNHFANTYQGKYSDSIPDVQGFYDSYSGYDDELVWSALWLYQATGEKSYLDAAESRFSTISGRTAWTLSWDDKSYGCYVLLARLTGKDDYHAAARAWLDRWAAPAGGVARTPGGLAWLSRWGSLRYAANTAFAAMVYSDVLDGQGLFSEKAQQYRSFAESQINYMLGDNPRRSSYVVGFGDNPPKNPHHRTAHGAWAASGSPDADPEISRHVLYGALVGGPASADDFDYVDDRGDWIRNEVALDYNACFTGALARMAQVFGGLPPEGFPPEEIRDKEFAVHSRVLSKNNLSVELGIILENRTAWPARAGENILVRYFIDLSDEIARGLDPASLSISSAYSQDAAVSSTLEPWDPEKGIYCVRIALSSDEFAPGTLTSCRREAQIKIVVPEAFGPFESENDWSMQGLDNTLAMTDFIPVYENGVLVAGLEPGDSPVTVNHAPVMGLDRNLVVAPDQLETSIILDLMKPYDPDGDPVSVTLTQAPDIGGLLLNGQPLVTGDIINPEQVPQLSVVFPQDFIEGAADAFALLADDGQGKTAEQRVLFTSVREGSGWDVHFVVNDQWEGGFVAEVALTNRTGSDMEEWILCWPEGPYGIVNLWNGIVKSQTGDFCVKNASWNGSVPDGGTVSFGFQGSGVAEIPSAFTINGDNQGGDPPPPPPPENHPPVVDPDKTVTLDRINQAVSLGISPPTDPDGDTVKILVDEVSGTAGIHLGQVRVLAGDVLSPEDLPLLTAVFTQSGAQEGLFCYTASDDQGMEASQAVTLRLEEPPPPGDLEASWTIVNQWTGGDGPHFQAEVRLENHGWLPAEWEVSWTFSGDHQITNFWSAEIIQEGQNATATSHADWNLLLQPGQALSFGMIIKGSPLDVVNLKARTAG